MASAQSGQAPRAVVMVRPRRFRSNPETAKDNAFQILTAEASPVQVESTAYREVSDMVTKLTKSGVTVHLFEDWSDETPDSVFPNNWFSTHSGGHVAVYPMYSLSRQRERRWDVIEMLKREYRVQDVVDYSGLENDGIFLEGTGAMVLDHIDRVAYAARSNRTDPIALERFCTDFKFEPMVFDASDKAGRPVYHTNVMMCVASDFVMIALGMLSDKSRAQEVCDRLEGTGRAIIDLTHEQIVEYAGNAIELQGTNGRFLAISNRAVRSLTKQQLGVIESSVEVLPFDIPTIELAGGSVRCMLAGIHLSARPKSASVTAGLETDATRVRVDVQQPANLRLSSLTRRFDCAGMLLG
jgi:hypothetical protein